MHPEARPHHSSMLWVVMQQYTRGPKLVVTDFGDGDRAFPFTTM
jgi:hypothetical protein